MATKKTSKTATATKATKGKKAEPTFNSFAATLNAPLKKGRSGAEKDAAQKRAEAKGREIDERLAKAKANATPKPANAKPKAKKADASPKKLSAIDAAAQLLTDTGEAMTCKAMIEAMGAKGLWSSPNGKTPHATLYSAILREITTKGDEARFRKTDRGQFAAT
jgi:hypothetical protein